MSATSPKLPSRTARAVRTEGGFSLLELTLAALVLGVGLALAAQGLLEAQRIFADAQRHLAGGSTELAAALLRGDARSARGVVAVSSGWSTAALRLEPPGGGFIEYRRRDDVLVRVRRDAAGAVGAPQVVARAVAGFRWQRRGDLLEVELALAPPPPRARMLRRRGPPLFATPPTERVTVALRAAPRTRW
ncbi:MAG TPA: hypothetical protein VMV46_23380 [Thermoanaerobaculia bacterium]|nr:hypothetical protein [Thermoanaerobaculia bacterium]